MKFKLLSLAALAASISSASAFSLDFSALDLTNEITLSEADELVIEVTDFGDVGFGVLEKGLEATVDASLTDLGGNFVPSIVFDDTRTITVSFFAGSDVENVTVHFVGLDGDESPVFTATSGQSGEISIPNGTVGIAGITFDRVGAKVPEPSTAILGCLGAIALLRRRR